VCSLTNGDLPSNLALIVVARPIVGVARRLVRACAVV
jgi:hypothetical protein